MVRNILKYGDPVLETSAELITEFDTPELHGLIADMWETMYAAKGVGLAAPQIGIGKCLSVIDTSVGEREEDKIVIINPEIVLKEGSQTGGRRLPEHSRISRAGDQSAQSARYGSK